MNTARNLNQKLSIRRPADLCFITSTPLEDIMEHLRQHQLNLIAGPVKRTGAMGQIVSLSFRYPDRNLIEVSNSLETPK